MASLRIAAVISFLIVQYHFLSAQKLPLDGAWKFSTNDDLAFAKPDFNDAQWKEKPADKLFFNRAELNGGSGYTWIRKTAVIPSSFRNRSRKTGAFAVYFGRIYQADELYINGELIGSTNSSDIRRAYIISPEIIHWDSANVFVLRIRHWADQSGLESKSAPFIDEASPASIFILKASAKGVSSKEQVNGKDAEYSLTVSNNSSKPVMAAIHAVFYDLANTVLNKADKNLTLVPGKNTISFPFTSPAAFLKVQYSVTVADLSYTAIWNDEYGYNDIVYKAATPVVADKIVERFTPADIQQQVIQGWLGDRMKANEEKRLLRVDENAILAGYINRPGDHPWIGEHVGKFLDAAANTYRSAGGERIKTQMDRTVQQFIAAQLADGYLGTYTADNYWTSWDVWSHKYNMIGLLNYYSLSGFIPALEAAKKAGDLLCRTFGNNPGQQNIVKAGAHVGMAATSVLEPMVELYRFSGDRKYLDFCYYIIKSYDQDNGPRIISTLNATGGRTDKTANAKAYEMLSNFVGILKLYKATGDEAFLKPMLAGWNDIIKNRMYITGTASSFEHFKDNDDLPASDNDNMGEGCVTTTWIQFNYQLLCISGEMKYLDELERAVYNHLTGAENPENGNVSYYTPLVGIKPYRGIITCCMSSVPRGISMIPLFANGKIDGNPGFLFYQPGTYSSVIGNQSKVSFTTITHFPADGNVLITVDQTASAGYGLYFRKPYWAGTFSVSVNGKKQTITNGDALVVKRRWKTADKIAIHFTMPVIVLQGGKTYPGQVALQRGPQVLAFDKSLNEVNASGVAIDVKKIQLQNTKITFPFKWIGAEAFELKAVVGKTDKSIIMVPYADAGQTGGSITTWIKEGQLNEK